MSPKLTLKERELAFCLKRLEQYWMLLKDKNAKRKLVGKKYNILESQLLLWEENIYIQIESIKK